MRPNRAKRCHFDSVPGGEHRQLTPAGGGRGDRHAAGPFQSSMAAHQGRPDSGYPVGLTGVVPVAEVSYATPSRSSRVRLAAGPPR